MASLRYIDDVDSAEEFWNTRYHGKQMLYERAYYRIFVDGRRVETPYSFSFEVTPPKGKRDLYQLQAESASGDSLWDFGVALEDALKNGSEVTTSHDVDGREATYLVKKTSKGTTESLTLSCELLSGDPTIFRNGKLIDSAGLQRKDH